MLKNELKSIKENTVVSNKIRFSRSDKKYINNIIKNYYRIWLQKGIEVTSFTILIDLSKILYQIIPSDDKVRLLIKYLEKEGLRVSNCRLEDNNYCYLLINVNW